MWVLFFIYKFELVLKEEFVYYLIQKSVIFLQRLRKTQKTKK
jgi:hypothetical protein